MAAYGYRDRQVVLPNWPFSFGCLGAVNHGNVRCAKPSSGSIDVCGLTVIKDAGVSRDKPVLNCLAPLVGWLVFVPEGRMGVKIDRSKYEWADADVVKDEGVR